MARVQEQKLTGKVALVTGSSRGIGRNIAEELALQGAKVIINYAGNSEKAIAVVAAIKRQGGEATAIQADISQVVEVERLFQRAMEAYGKIDILVNNAGIMITKPVTAVTEEDFDRIFAVNVKGTYFACQQAARHMAANGRIINFSTSVAGLMFPAYSIYAGTKGAVEQFTRQLAKEFGPRGITINAVAPGPVNTELFTVGKTKEQIETLTTMNAFGRLGETADIAKVVLWLAGQEAQWITGQTIRVNGGFI
ncbi:SDR family oxidoreductase [Anaerospora hongkongensis]|jgi:3-oxoacyl-[acyl-carrier protein] reductase|uniref:SDR family oxidoreductase n=1 Tax=Anaerospora hongkongensis TaxID=244830 RepID=UPI00289FCC19|nr:SDR family oxidoreductase [Anaerospora hongkongensis]